MKKVKYLIIGGGISGLQLGTKLKKDYLIIEKQSLPGGYCKSFYQDGFVWDYGGHFFHGNNISEKFINNKKVILKEKNTKIYFNNFYIDYPFQNNIDQLDFTNYKYCLDKYEQRKKINRNNNFLSNLYSDYGEGIVDIFLRPYNEKLYACDLNSLDVDAMGRFFPTAPIDVNNKCKSYNDIYYASSNGAQEYIDMLLRKINKDSIILNCECFKIDYLNKIIYTTQGKIKYQFLINTAPFNEFLKFIDEEKYNNIISTKFNYNKVAIFNMGFDKKDVNKYHWIYYPQRDICFYRVGSYSNIYANSDNMSLYVEIGLKNNEVINERQKIKDILKDLKKVGIIKNHNLLSYKCLIANPAYVHITKDSLKIVKKAKEYLKNYNIFTIGRYGNWTYCSMMDCVEEANRLAEIIG